MRTLPAVLLYAAVAVSAVGCSSAEDGFREGFAAGSAAASSSAAAPTTEQTTPTAEPVRDLTIPEIPKGQNGRIALDALERAGFTNVEPASQDTEDKVVINAANWKVVSVEPSAGTSLPSDSTIVVTMTKQG